MFDSAKKRWEEATPKTKRNTVLVIGAILVLIFVYFFATATTYPEKKKANPRDQIATSYLTSANPRALGIDGLNNRTQKLGHQIGEISQRLSNLTDLIQQNQGAIDDNGNRVVVSPSDLKRELDQLRKRMDKKISQAELKQKVVHEARPPADTSTSDDEADDTGKDKTGEVVEPPPYHPDVDPQLWNEPAPISTAPSKSKKKDDVNTDTVNIRVIGANEDEDEKGQDENGDRPGKGTGVYMPAGSIISGVLLTGMDAPTNNSARKEPFPALIRVKKEAILPNHYRLNVRECFVIASGYGDLSSERAYLRAETLSCVRNDGGVIEVPLKAYAAGTDGKVGMHGKVVSKQGQMLAKSMAAGFFSGMSQVFNSVPVPTLQTSSDGSVPYQKVLSGDSMTSGVVKGASSALDRLAKYYLDMAKNIFPVIEINAGRRVDFIVTQGGEMYTVDKK